MAVSRALPPSWFDLRHYEGTTQLDFEGWRTQVDNRLYLSMLLLDEETLKQSPVDDETIEQFKEQFDEQFAKIQASPFFDLGAATVFVSEKAVYPLTFGVAQGMVDTLVERLTPASPEMGSSCDEMLRQLGDQLFAMQAHLTVDLRASEVEMRSAFEAWLGVALPIHRERIKREREAGVTTSLIKSWVEFQVLPYEDLRLWHKRHGKKMPSDTVLAEWLYAEHDGDKDKVRETRRKAKLTFTRTTVRQLALAASGA